MYWKAVWRSGGLVGFGLREGEGLTGFGDFVVVVEEFCRFGEGVGVVDFGGELVGVLRGVSGRYESTMGVLPMLNLHRASAPQSASEHRLPDGQIGGT